MAGFLQQLFAAGTTALLVVALAAPVVIGARDGGFVRALTWGWGLLILGFIIQDVLPIILAGLGARDLATAIASDQPGLVAAALVGWLPACLGFPLGRLIRCFLPPRRGPGDRGRTATR